VSDELVRGLGRIWLDYARYLEERRKFISAQKVYLKALTERRPEDDASQMHPQGGAVADEDDRNMLWQEFLRMMQQRKNNPNLTLETLQAAVAEEHVGGKANTNATAGSGINANADAQPPPVTSSMSEFPPPPASAPPAPPGPAPIFTVPFDTSAPPPKRTRLDDATGVGGIEQDLVAIGKRVEGEARELAQVLVAIPPDVQAAWMANDGNAAPYRPIVLFGPSPPKLSDASGSDILGPDLAMELVRMLLMSTFGPGSKAGLAGKALLQVCKSCWIMIALKEKEAAKALSDLEGKLVSRRSSCSLISESFYCRFGANSDLYHCSS
jgi:hypothetical protein